MNLDLMPIKNSSDQKGKTLEEFYMELSEHKSNNWVHVGKKMLELIKMINNIFEETQLWGLTSHARLVIQSEDNWESNWYIIIASNGTDNYFFEYLIPEDKQPWEGAMVRGEAKSIKEAKKFLLIAMKECQGWKGNLELERLLYENGIK